MNEKPRRPTLVLPVSSAPSPIDSAARFQRLAGHLRVHGKPLEPLPWCVTPEAQQLRQTKAAK